MIGIRLANKNFEDITEFRPLPLKGLEWSFIKQEVEPDNEEKTQPDS